MLHTTATHRSQDNQEQSLLTTSPDLEYSSFRLDSALAAANTQPLRNRPLSWVKCRLNHSLDSSDIVTSVERAEDMLVSSAKDAGYLVLREGKQKVFWRRYTPPCDGNIPPKATILLIPGFGEHVGLFDDTCRRLLGSGFHVLAFDPPSFGQSQHGYKPGHVQKDQFPDLLQIISGLIKHCVLHKDRAPVYLYGHCSGGTTAIAYAMASRRPIPQSLSVGDLNLDASSVSSSSFSGSVLLQSRVPPQGTAGAVAAMNRSFVMPSRTKLGGRHSMSGIDALSSIGMDFEPIDGCIVTAPLFRMAHVHSFIHKLLLSAVSFLHKGHLVREDSPVERLTSDPVVQEMLRKDPLRTNEISAQQLHGWEQLGKETLARAKEFKHPILLLHGEEDTIASPESSEQFIDACGSNDKKLILLKNFLHNIHHETDREFVFSRIVAWLNERTGSVDTPYSDVSGMYTQSIISSCGISKSRQSSPTGPLASPRWLHAM